MNPVLVSISIGSNIDAEQNIAESMRRLHQLYGPMRVSPVYQTEAVGFEGDDFLNLVVCFKTSKTVHEVALELKHIEDVMGRDRSQPKFSSRLIDLDLLTYDALVLDDGAVQVPRDEILKYAFVLKPLCDLLPEVEHPETNTTFQALWQAMEPNAERIKMIESTLDDYAKTEAIVSES